MKVAILGMGEVGRALCELYKENKIIPITKDIKDKTKFKNISVLNICIPYNKNFIKNVSKEILNSNSKLTIIHSTVSIGTTEKIKKLTSKNIVHSPIIGSHPFLKDSLKKFTKYIGSSDKESIRLTKTHYNKLRLKYKTISSSKATEIAKLLCTSYYGLCIIWHDYMNDICKKNNIDFSFIKEWNDNYNIGYKEFNLSKYNRPVLDSPKSKKIGGHCVIPNAKLLNGKHPNILIKEILKFQ
jgi:UDP-glucose 6-dehydrogenase